MLDDEIKDWTVTLLRKDASRAMDNRVDADGIFLHSLMITVTIALLSMTLLWHETLSPQTSQ
ncbi:MAG: hypothetical protein GEU26_07975 [Nitrososphaeraceae archaeon]|nr:hypothetical protein [Nitrososphaeraceae archaeon]